MFEASVGDHSVESPVPPGCMQQIAVVAAEDLQTVLVAIVDLLRREVHSHRLRPAPLRKLEQVTVSAADFQQAEARPVAADLIEEIVELPLDTFFERSINR